MKRPENLVGVRVAPWVHLGNVGLVPIVREQDEKAFKKYRTKEMILAYMRAFAAGGTESRVAV